jgi:Nickel responsive protein SCO4226-like
MTIFLVEAHLTAATPPGDLEARARAAAEAMAKEGVAVLYVRSIFMPADETCFHIFEAPSQEIVAEVSRRASLPCCTRVVEALCGSEEEVRDEAFDFVEIAGAALTAGGAWAAIAQVDGPGVRSRRERR